VATTLSPPQQRALAGPDPSSSAEVPMRHPPLTLKDGLLVEVTSSAYKMGITHTHSIFLTNFPGLSKAYDGQRIEFLALKTGLYKNASQTLERYDYGIPYNPFAKQPQAKPAEPKKKSAGSTNAP
jgi:hypothetical protein